MHLLADRRLSLGLDPPGLSMETCLTELRSLAGSRLYLEVVTLYTAMLEAGEARLPG